LITIGAFFWDGKYFGIFLFLKTSTHMLRERDNEKLHKNVCMYNWFILAP